VRVGRTAAEATVVGRVSEWGEFFGVGFHERRDLRTVLSAGVSYRISRIAKRNRRTVGKQAQQRMDTATFLI
jgi:hypothetical protein